MKRLLVGTNKGLFCFRNENGGWKSDLFYKGQSIFSIGGSAKRIWAAPFTEWMGTSLVFSEDLGETWNTVEEPIAFPEDTGAALAKIWQICVDKNGRIFCGVEPSALFISDDEGLSWELNAGLWNHPHREQWQPGYGGLCLHTIIPLSDEEWVVGTSTGGVYRTEDGGKNWEACNQKIVTPFLPEETPEFGQCVHKIAYHPSNPDRLLLQHHWGVYRSDDRGKNWSNTAKEKLPSDFGFGCVMNKPDTAFLIPIEADEFRCFPEGKLRVYRTTDGGESFEALTEGLPQKDVFDCVLRDSLDARGDAVAFGTTGGSLYLSENNGDSWTAVADHLPRITCVRVID